MLRLNIRHRLPQIGIHTQLGQLSSHSTPARLSTEGRQARSNKGWTQPEISIDTYPSRHSYGYTNHTDFAKEQGQKGFSDLAQFTSGRTEQAWANVENGGKPGRNPELEEYKNDLWSRISQQRHIVAESIPDPQITVTTSQSTGTPDLGDVSTNVDVDAFAQVSFQRGSVDTYIKDQGYLRQWTTEDRYDIYA